MMLLLWLWHWMSGPSSDIQDDLVIGPLENKITIKRSRTWRHTTVTVVKTYRTQMYPLFSDQFVELVLELEREVEEELDTMMRRKKFLYISSCIWKVLKLMFHLVFGVNFVVNMWMFVMSDNCPPVRYFFLFVVLILFEQFDMFKGKD